MFLAFIQNQLSLCLYFRLCFLFKSWLWSENLHYDIKTIRWRIFDRLLPLNSRVWREWCVTVEELTGQGVKICPLIDSILLFLCFNSFENLPSVLLSRSEVNGPGADGEIRKTTPSIFPQTSQSSSGWIYLFNFAVSEDISSYQVFSLYWCCDSGNKIVNENINHMWWRSECSTAVRIEFKQSVVCCLTKN